MLFLCRSSSWDWESFPVFLVYSRIGFVVLFYHEWMLVLSNAFFWINWYHVVDYTDWVSNTEPALQIWTITLIKWEVTRLLFSGRQYKWILWKFCKIFQRNHMGLEVSFLRVFNYKFNFRIRFSALSWLRFGGLRFFEEFDFF